MREIPLSVYLHWPAPNYENPTTRGDALLAINIVFITLVTLSIGVRLYSRMMVKHQSGIDDVMIVLAYIFTIGMTAVVLLANRNFGWNRHMWDVEASMIQNANIIAFTAKIMFTLASSFVRLSLIFLYYRLIRDTQIRWYSWALHINLAFNLIILIIFVLLTVFTCIPVQAYWQFPDVIDGTCLDEGITTLSCGIVTCVADLLCTVLPIPAILRLRMPLRQRIGVCVLLSAGILVTVAGIIRTWFIWKSLIATYDETWFTYPLWICAALEIDIAVICACVPAMKTVLWKPFRRWTGDMYSNWTSSSHQASRSNNKVGLSSQEPIVKRKGPSHNQYRLDDMDIEKADYLRRPRDPNTLNQAIAQLPSAGHHHPHHINTNANTKDSADYSSDYTQQLPRSVYNGPPTSEIHKETTVEVSSESDIPYYMEKSLPKAPPRGQLPHRARHTPLVPHQQQDNVTPRGWSGITSSRRNAPAGLAPSSPTPPPVSQFATAPLSPASPMSVGSGEMSPAVPASKKKRQGGTFFFS